MFTQIESHTNMNEAGRYIEIVENTIFITEVVSAEDANNPYLEDGSMEILSYYLEDRQMEELSFYEIVYNQRQAFVY